MSVRNAAQLKAFVRKKAKEKNISVQLVLQNYMLERLRQLPPPTAYALEVGASCFNHTLYPASCLRRRQSVCACPQA